MRFQRLLMEAGGSTVTVDLHPRLTVVAGVGDLERESLVTELFGGLAGHRPGTHLELVDDTGRRLGVLHPSNGQPEKVVELTTHQDVTSEFRADDGMVDLLAPLGLDLATAKRRCRVTAGDVAAAAHVDMSLAALAAHDQDVLWAAAERVRSTEAALKAEVAAMGADPEDAPLFEEIERRHAAFEGAQRRLESVRHHGIFIGGACVLAAFPAVALRSIVAVPLLAVAIVTTVVSIVFRRRMQSARKAEAKALEAAGADSYLSFRLQRMNAMFDGADRDRLAAVAAEHQAAEDAWHALAGDVSVDWAFDLRDKVLAAAERLRGSRAGGAKVSVAADPAELAQALIARMSELRHGGARGECLPLVLDEPLSGVPLSIKHWMLELIGRSAGSPQIILLTADPDIEAWARIEAVSGELSILAPAPERESEPVL